MANYSQPLGSNIIPLTDADALNSSVDFGYKKGRYPLLGIQQDEQGQKRIVMVISEAFTLWNQSLAYFNYGLLASIDYKISSLASYFESK